MGTPELNPEKMPVIVLVYIPLLLAGLAAGVAVLAALLRKAGPWEAGLRALRSRPWRSRDVLWIVLGLLIAQGGARLLAAFDILAVPQNSPPDLVIRTLLTQWLGLALIVWRMVDRDLAPAEAFNWAPAGGAWRRPALVAYLSSLPILTVVGFFNYYVLIKNGMTWSLQDTLLILTDDMTWGYRVYFILLAVVLAPVVEEIFFRGMLLPVLARRLGTGWGVVLSAVVFASIHGHLPAFLPLFTIAIGFSLVYLYTGNIAAAMAMHGLFNGVNMAIVLAARN